MVLQVTRREGAVMKPLLEFTAHGRAIPKGNLSIGGSRQYPKLRETNDKALDSWLTDLRTAAAVAMVEAGYFELFDQPLCLTVNVYFQRPGSHLTSKGVLSAQGLREPFPKRHRINKMNIGDLDKLLRAIGDGLTGQVWKDDSQIVGITGLWKLWGEPQRAGIKVYDAAKVCGLS